MPVQVTYPGVYVQEAPSGVHTIAQVATSVAAFVGMTPSGPVNQPTSVFSYREFDRVFGGTPYVGELPDQVMQFFLNGGSEAWIVRNAKDAADGTAMMASSQLLTEGNAKNAALNPSLVVTATNAGSAGNAIQIQIDYQTASPERTFNLSVFQPVTKSDGSTDVKRVEHFVELSMDPSSINYAPKVVTKGSALITATLDPAAPAPGNLNFSQSGLIFGDIKTFVTDNLGAGPKLMMVAVANKPPVMVDLQGLPTTSANDITDAIAKAINDALQTAGQTATVTADATISAGAGNALRIYSNDGPVVITSAPSSDVAGLFQLGAANGGLEFDCDSPLRPAASGFTTHVSTGTTFTTATVLTRLCAFAGVAKKDVGAWTIVASPGKGGPGVELPAFQGNADTMAADTAMTLTGTKGTFNGISESLQAIVDAINGTPGIQDDFQAYSTRTRIGILPKYGGASSDLQLQLTSAGAYSFDGANPQNIAPKNMLPTNVVRYPIGAVVPPAPAGGPGGAFRVRLQSGKDGDLPVLADYLYSWDKLERVADIFNILVLPRAQSTAARQTDVDRSKIWPSASQFCKRLRAFLLVDPPVEDWTNAWVNVAKAVGDIANFRGPLQQDYAAVYWPRVITNNVAGDKITLDPSGTIAGLYAKTDVARGVWKAPAGLEATLAGVTGLELLVTNDENGQTNPQAINTLRMKVSGVTSWGARTLMGFDGTADEDYRYVPVRRLALLIEESLYRGLQFAVFEPNDEPLWGQIRMAAGSFMNGLFKEGAFKGLKASDAYYVACGPSTTTQADINKGIVNVEVGFAPLKPAEFVVITLKQLAGQIQV